MDFSQGIGSVQRACADRRPAHMSETWPKASVRCVAVTRPESGPDRAPGALHTRAREIIEEFRAATITQSFLAGLEIANRRITPLPQDDLDSLQHQIMNLRALIKGNLAQRFVDRCWKV
jgi:hypothetical protein